MVEAGGKYVTVLFPIGPGLDLAIVQGGIDGQYRQSLMNEPPGHSVDFGKIPQAVITPSIPENKQHGLSHKSCTGDEFAVKSLHGEIRDRISNLGAPRRKSHHRQ